MAFVPIHPYPLFVLVPSLPLVPSLSLVLLLPLPSLLSIPIEVVSGHEACHVYITYWGYSPSSELIQN